MNESISIVIGKTEFSYWTDVNIVLSVDSFATVEFTAPFDPDRKELREVLQPFSFQPIQLKLDGELLFTGTMIGVDPTFDANGSTVKVSAYAQPGVLCDCTAPSGFGRKGKWRGKSGAIPLSWTKATLRDIATQLCQPFGLPIEFRPNDIDGRPFESIAIRLDEDIHKFLTELAKQRGLVLTNNPDGSLLFWRSITGGTPVVRLVEGTPPLLGVQSTFSPQEYYSEITGYAAARRRKQGSVYTYVNPWLGSGIDDGSGPINQHRPRSCKFDDTERADAPAATRAKVGRMFANMASFTVDLPTWRAPAPENAGPNVKGKLWAPNTSLTLRAPSAMVYKETELLIRNVHLKQTPEEISASLDLVLPGAFSGESPSTLPWLDA